MHPSPHKPSCIGVLLAGGRSRRMGRDKALLEWRGRPLLERQIAVLHQAGVDAVKVSGERPGYAAVADVTPQAGPLAGLVSVAAALEGDATLLVIPVDMPLMQPQLLRRLRREQPGAICLRFAGKVLPLRLRLDASARAVLERLLRSEDSRQHSLRALQSELAAEEIALSPAEAGQLADCNTPAAWEAAQP